MSSDRENGKRAEALRGEAAMKLAIVNQQRAEMIASMQSVSQWEVSQYLEEVDPEFDELLQDPERVHVLMLLLDEIQLDWKRDHFADQLKEQVGAIERGSQEFGEAMEELGQDDPMLFKQHLSEFRTMALLLKQTSGKDIVVDTRDLFEEHWQKLLATLHPDTKEGEPSEEAVRALLRSILEAEQGVDKISLRLPREGGGEDVSDKTSRQTEGETRAKMLTTMAQMMIDYPKREQLADKLLGARGDKLPV